MSVLAPKSKHLHLYSDDDLFRVEIEAGDEPCIEYKNIATGEQFALKVAQLTVEDGVNVATALTDLAAADVAEREARISSLTELDDILSASIASEQTRATAAELQISTDITEHFILREQGDVAVAQVLTAQVTAERERAELVEADLATQVTNNLVSRETEDVAIRQDLAAESSRATIAESVNTGLVDTEKVRALAAEAVISAALTTEQNRASDAETDLRSDLDVQTALLSQETTRAVAAENQLTNSLAVESSRAQAAELAEKTRAEAKEAELAAQIGYVTNNIDPAALDSLTEIVAQVNAVDTSLYARIFTLESFIKTAFDLESLYPLKLEDMQQVTIALVDSGPVAADEGVPVACPEGGWGFQNSEDITMNKINWYLHGQDETSNIQLEKYSGFYAKVHLKSIGSLPFFSLYTKPKGDGTDAGSWYGSRRTYVFPAESGVAAGDSVMMYFGVDLPAIFPDIPHIQLVLDAGTSNGSDEPSQAVFSIAVSTDSAAPKNDVNMCITDFVVGNGKHTHVVLDSSSD